MIKSALFDYNGTLYDDFKYHVITWKETLDELSNGKINFDYFFSRFAGAMDRYVIKDAFDMINVKADAEEIEKWAQIKEKKYRDYLINNHIDNSLPKGVEKLLDYIKAKGLPMNICTSSIKENVEFYFEFLKLDRWFDIKKVAYDNGIHKNKKTMYEECAKNSNVDMKDALVFEDSPTSIKEAIAAGARNIIALKRPDSIMLPEIKQIINDFSEVDYSIFD